MFFANGRFRDFGHFFPGIMPGRDEDTVWRVFKKFQPPDKKYFYAKCLGCNTDMPGMA
jgi:hypothetical protein